MRIKIWLDQGSLIAIDNLHGHTAKVVWSEREAL
jgi:hypothetical protein